MPAMRNRSLSTFVIIYAFCFQRRNQIYKFNCCWMFFDKTSALCLTIIDAFGDVWTVKLLANSRAKVGQYLDQRLGVEQICLRIRVHLKQVDQLYLKYVGSYQGSYQPSEPLMSSTFTNFWLDNKCCYVST